MRKITILIPAYNEAPNLPALLSELEKLTAGTLPDVQLPPDAKPMTDYEWEFLFVDDGSRDDTLQILLDARRHDPRINIVALSRNFGKERAMLAGMDMARGDALVIIDADLQHPLRYIPEMVYWWDCKGYDDVYARRDIRGRESIWRKGLTSVFYKILHSDSGVEMLPGVGDFRLLDRKAFDAIRSLRESERYTKGLYCWVGYKKKEISYHLADRHMGQSTFSFIRLLNLAIDGITGFNTKPLRIASVAGILSSIIAIFYGIYILVRTLIYGDPVAGFPTLVCLILFLGGLQLLAIGIIGEYIAKIFYESKRRPTYIIGSYNGAPVCLPSGAECMNPHLDYLRI